MSRGWYSYPLIHVDYADERAGGEGSYRRGERRMGKLYILMRRGAGSNVPDQ
jgi:hypothetical protein